MPVVMKKAPFNNPNYLQSRIKKLLQYTISKTVSLIQLFASFNLSAEQAKR